MKYEGPLLTESLPRNHLRCFLEAFAISDFLLRKAFLRPHNAEQHTIPFQVRESTMILLYACCRTHRDGCAVLREDDQVLHLACLLCISGDQEQVFFLKNGVISKPYREKNLINHRPMLQDLPLQIHTAASS
jgi:hypothetical protein